MRRITKIGEEHVVVRRQHLREMLSRARVQIEPKEFADRCGRFYVFHLERWRDLLDVVREGYATARAGNGCDDFCGAACADNNGCDFSFGDPPDCGASCVDGEVFLQQRI